MSLEKTGYSGDTTYRKPEFLDTWTVVANLFMLSNQPEFWEQCVQNTKELF